MVVVGGTPAPERLLRELAELDRTIQAALADEFSFRQANAGFSSQNETTKLLLAACEKLAVERETRAQQGFEEHTCELSYLVSRLETSVDRGLPRHARREGADGRPGAAGVVHGRRASFFACCNREFPPRQSWWLDVDRRLCPSFQVLREGRLVTALDRELLPGDVVHLCAGQQCAADARVLVHEEDTVVDASHLTLEHEDMRRCTVEATSASMTDSANIVLRGSYVVSGALFCLVLRCPSEAPLVPGRTLREPLGEGRFFEDRSVPPGHSARQCRALFKQLCVRGRLVCRSFASMASLARVRTLLVVLTQELVDRGTVPALGAAARRLGKALVLVPCGCTRASVEALAREVQVGLVDFGSHQRAGSNASAAPAETASVDRRRGADRLMHSDSVSSGMSSQLSSSPWVRRRCDRVEDQVLGSLSEDIAEERIAGVVLWGVSEEAIVTFCYSLSDRGSAPLYAMGALQLPTCFRQMVVSRGVSMTCEPTSGVEVDPHLNFEESRGRQSTPRLTRPSGPAVTRMASRTSSMSASPSPTLAPDPVVQLRAPSNDRGPPLQLVLCVNSIGVVSEYADCVLMTSDLGVLGLSLELAHRLRSSQPYAASSKGA